MDKIHLEIHDTSITPETCIVTIKLREFKFGKGAECEAKSQTEESKASLHSKDSEWNIPVTGRGGDLRTPLSRWPVALAEAKSAEAATMRTVVEVVVVDRLLSVIVESLSPPSWIATSQRTCP
jgi:hypothetical protein